MVERRAQRGDCPPQRLRLGPGRFSRKPGRAWTPLIAGPIRPIIGHKWGRRRTQKPLCCPALASSPAGFTPQNARIPQHSVVFAAFSLDRKQAISH